MCHVLVLTDVCRHSGRVRSFYHTMGLTACLAADAEHYVSTAVRVGSDHTSHAPSQAHALTCPPRLPPHGSSGPMRPIAQRSRRRSSGRWIASGAAWRWCTSGQGSWRV
jgi:hypothetical protein